MTLFPWFAHKNTEPLYRPRPLPDLIPAEAELKHWAASPWIEYQAWLYHHSFLSLHDWFALRAVSQQIQPPVAPRFSILTPVYNTPPAFLRACIYSVQTQAYPYWEMCLVDDGSTQPDTLALLDTICAADPRLKRVTLANNQGICAATNHALAIATGDYVAFLDHDDRLAPDALYWMAETLLDQPGSDVLYSDRDMLSPEDLRFMHLFKPGWSPETLLSGNYLFHLLVYRRELLNQLGGVQADYEGSQDYDLILRAADQGAQVRHVPKVLYHWRQHSASVSLDHDSKAYAYDAGMRALSDSLRRRGLVGCVEENPRLWRGNYRVRLQAPPHWQTVQIDAWELYAAQVNQALADTDAPYLLVLGPGVTAVNAESGAELVAWLQDSAIVMAGGQVLDAQQRILHAGLVLRADAPPLSIYREFPHDTPTYMAATANLRNVSVPHPACCALDVAWLKAQGGLLTDYAGPYAVLDAALDALQQARRIVYNPFAQFQADAATWPWPELWPERALFAARWQAVLQSGDRYYNHYLSTEVVDMGLDIRR